MSLKNLAGKVAIKNGWVPIGNGRFRKNNVEMFLPELTQYLKYTPMGVASRTRVNKKRKPNMSGVINEVKRRKFRSNLVPNTFRYNIGMYGANYSNVFHLSQRQYVVFLKMIRDKLKNGNVSLKNAQNIARKIRFGV